MGTSAAPAIEVEHLHKTYGKARRNEPVMVGVLRASFRGTVFLRVSLYHIAVALGN